jgi:hypothetical protein
VQITGDYSPFQGHLSSAELELRAEHGEASKDIANLLRRAAGQNRSDLLDLVASYNRANGSN